MLKSTICLILLLALFQTITARHCTTKRVCVWRSYYTNFCYNRNRRCVNYRTYRVKVYKTKCRRVRRYCGLSCRFVASHKVKCTKVRKPYFKYVTVTKTYKKRTCKTSVVNRSFWNYQRCLKCNPTTYTKKVRVRKCYYRTERKCTRHCIRRRVCRKRYHYIKQCRQYYSHTRTYRKKYVTYRPVRFCRRIKRYRRSFKTIKKCSQCRGVPQYYDSKVFYRSARQFRRRALQRCCNKDLFTFYQCVFDRAHGEVNTRREAQRVRHAINRRGGSHAICASTGDPHLRSFCGNAFNVYKASNQLLYHAGGVRVVGHTKYSKWGMRSINNRVTVQVGTSSYLFTLPSTSVYTGCKWHSTLSAKGSKKYVKVKRSYKHYREYVVSYNNHVVKVAIHARGYIDVYVYAPKCYAYNAKGFCNGCNVRGNFTIKHIYNIKFKSACVRKRNRWNHCKTICKNSSQILKCMMDMA